MIHRNSFWQNTNTRKIKCKSKIKKKNPQWENQGLSHKSKLSSGECTAKDPGPALEFGATLQNTSSSGNTSEITEQTTHKWMSAFYIYRATLWKWKAHLSLKSPNDIISKSWSSTHTASWVCFHSHSFLCLPSDCNSLCFNSPFLSWNWRALFSTLSKLLCIYLNLSMAGWCSITYFSDSFPGPQSCSSGRFSHSLQPLLTPAGPLHSLFQFFSSTTFPAR